MTLRPPGTGGGAREEEASPRGGAAGVGGDWVDAHVRGAAVIQLGEA